MVTELKEALMADLTAQEKITLQKLLDDYKAAAKEPVPGYKGGRLSHKIAISLVPDGWRRQKPNSN